MAEQILAAIVGSDEAVALGGVEPPAAPAHAYFRQEVKP